MFELHDTTDDKGRARSYDEARKVFFDVRQGCGALFNGKPCERRDTERGEASGILAEMLGSDVDGIASMMADY